MNQLQACQGFLMKLIQCSNGFGDQKLAEARALRIMFMVLCLSLIMISDHSLTIPHQDNDSLCINCNSL